MATLDELLVIDMFAFSLERPLVVSHKYDIYCSYQYNLSFDKNWHFSEP